MATVASPGSRTAPPAAAARARARGVTPGAWRRAVALALLGVAFLADVLTGNEASSSLYYLAAVAWAAWFLDAGWGLAMAVAGGTAWLTAYLLARNDHASAVVLAWNVAGELVVYGAAALGLARVRSDSARTRALAAELLEANERLDREARAVGRLQTGMLPASPPALPGHEWAIHYETSTRAGGDYYDFAAPADGRAVVLVADASGHGPAAAVLMAVTRAAFLEAAARAEGPGRVLAAMNHGLCRQIPPGWFVTAACIVLDPATGAFEYALAGHEPPRVARHGRGTVEVLEPCGGPMLGPFPDASFAPGRARLAPGDALVLLTDGLTEAADPDGALLGARAVDEALLAGGPAGAAALRDRLLARVRRHRRGAPASDDLTVLVLRRLERENAPETADGAAVPPN